MQIPAKILVVLLCNLFALPAGIAAGSLPGFDRVRALEPAREIADVALVDQDGDAFSLRQLRGRVALVFFGFTHCPDVCPMALQRMREFDQSGGSDLDQVAFVMISVDGERDTPPVLKRFLAGFSPRFIGATGETKNVKKMAGEFKAAFFKGAASGDNYSVSHSPQVFVVDPAGMLRAEFYNASVDAMAGIARSLLEEVESRQAGDTSIRE